MKTLTQLVATLTQLVATCDSWQPGIAIATDGKICHNNPARASPVTPIYNMSI